MAKCKSAAQPAQAQTYEHADAEVLLRPDIGTRAQFQQQQPPAEEVLVDRPEVASGIVRATDPFCFEATIPTAAEFQPQMHADERGSKERGVAAEDGRQPEHLRSSASICGQDHSFFIDRTLEVPRRRPVLRLEGSLRRIGLGPSGRRATSAPFERGEHGQIAVQMIDDRGNELLVVRKLKETR